MGVHSPPGGAEFLDFRGTAGTKEIFWSKVIGARDNFSVAKGPKKILAQSFEGGLRGGGGGGVVPSC